MRAVCTAHLTLLYFITRMLFGEEYRPRRASFWLPHAHNTTTNNAFCDSVVQTISTDFVRFFAFPCRHCVTQRQRHLLTKYAAHLNPSTHKTHLPKRQHTPAPTAAVQNK